MISYKYSNNGVVSLQSVVIYYIDFAFSILKEPNYLPEGPSLCSSHVHIHQKHHCLFQDLPEETHFGLLAGANLWSLSLIHKNGFLSAGNLHKS